MVQGTVSGYPQRDRHIAAPGVTEPIISVEPVRRQARTDALRVDRPWLIPLVARLGGNEQEARLSIGCGAFPQVSGSEHFALAAGLEVSRNTT